MVLPLLTSTILPAPRTSKINPSGKMSITYPKSSDQLNMGTAYYGRQGDNCVLHHFHILQHATQCDVALAIEQQSDSVGDCR
ncbi:hypothetical protein Ae201684P_011962 [Aphanomyces euteiches]|nr:hypothetical protein Ae201684P_011962 [Aphanomyces euteiches]